MVDSSSSRLSDVYCGMPSASGSCGSSSSFSCSLISTSGMIGTLVAVCTTRAAKVSSSSRNSPLTSSLCSMLMVTLSWCAYQAWMFGVKVRWYKFSTSSRSCMWFSRTLYPSNLRWSGPMCGWLSCAAPLAQRRRRSGSSRSTLLLVLSPVFRLTRPRIFCRPSFSYACSAAYATRVRKRWGVPMRWPLSFRGSHHGSNSRG